MMCQIADFRLVYTPPPQKKKPNKLKYTDIRTFLFKQKLWKWIGELLHYDDNKLVI